MQTFDRKKHWEEVYKNKRIDEVSWYQPIPTTSLDFIRELKVPKEARIIDVGGGDSLFADHLLEKGYTDITVLDISEMAIARARKRLGRKAEKVKWIVADAANYKPARTYDFWHDRAAFHFLTDKKEIESYINNLKEYIHPSGHLVLGTFSTQGPIKCSGINITQYSEQSMSDLLSGYFKLIRCIKVDHHTPSKKIQNFIFCSFERNLHDD